MPLSFRLSASDGCHYAAFRAAFMIDYRYDIFFGITDATRARAMAQQKAAPAEPAGFFHDAASARLMRHARCMLRARRR
jgi:hypothetical protein